MKKYIVILYIKNEMEDKKNELKIKKGEKMENKHVTKTSSAHNKMKQNKSEKI